jgi:hypothetical protein
VTVSEGEAEFYQSDGTTVRKYYAGGTLGSITGGGSGVTRLVVLTSAAVLQQPGLGFLAGVDYPDSALWNQVVLASVTRTVAGVVITTGEIDQTTFRDQ